MTKYRLTKHPILEIIDKKEIAFTWNGKKLKGYDGEMISSLSKKYRQKFVMSVARDTMRLRFQGNWIRLLLRGNRTSVNPASSTS